MSRDYYIDNPAEDAAFSLRRISSTLEDILEAMNRATPSLSTVSAPPTTDPEGLRCMCGYTFPSGNAQDIVRHMDEDHRATPAPTTEERDANGICLDCGCGGNSHFRGCDGYRAVTPAPLDERCHCGHLNASCDRPDKETK
jgi:hypothetical protein